MNLGHVTKIFEVDYNGCESNEGIFHIEVRQDEPELEEGEEEPPPITSMRFHASFENN